MVRPAWRIMLSIDFVWSSSQLETGCVQQILHGGQAGRFCLVMKPDWNLTTEVLPFPRHYL